MDGEVVVRLLNMLVMCGVVMVAWLLFEPVWKGVRNMMTQAEWDDQFKLPSETSDMPEFHHVGIPLDCTSCEAMLEKHKFTWLECTQAHWKNVTNRVQALKSLPPGVKAMSLTTVPDALALPRNLMEVGFRPQYKWGPEPEKVAEVFRVKKKHDIENVSDGKGDLS